MASRGSKARNGHITTDEFYEDKSQHILDAKVLLPRTNNHGLPDYSHTANRVYIKMKHDGKTFHEMRVYGENHMPVIEIAYHPEPKLNNGDRQNPYLHMHTFSGIDRNPAEYITKSVKEKYKKYLKEFGLYD